MILASMARHNVLDGWKKLVCPPNCSATEETKSDWVTLGQSVPPKSSLLGFSPDSDEGSVQMVGTSMDVGCSMILTVHLLQMLWDRVSSCSIQLTEYSSWRQIGLL